MRKLHIFPISLCITKPCFAQTQADNVSNSPEDDCFPKYHPDFAQWVLVGKPACWCYRKQCCGDTDGISFVGKPVILSDLAVFKTAFNKTNEQLMLVPDGIFADLNHATFFGKRITITDLNTFEQYFNLPESQVPADCWCAPW